MEYLFLSVDNYKRQLGLNQNDLSVFVDRWREWRPILHHKHNHHIQNNRLYHDLAKNGVNSR